MAHCSEQVSTLGKRDSSCADGRSGLLPSKRLPSKGLQSSVCRVMQSNTEKRLSVKKRERRCIGTETANKEVNGSLSYAVQTLKQQATVYDDIFDSNHTDSPYDFHDNALSNCDAVNRHNHSKFRGMPRRSALKTTCAGAKLHLQHAFCMHAGVKSTAVNKMAHCSSNLESSAVSERLAWFTVGSFALHTAVKHHRPQPSLCLSSFKSLEQSVRICLPLSTSLVDFDRNCCKNGLCPNTQTRIRVSLLIRNAKKL
jgi:hypothetical protein